MFCIYLRKTKLYDFFMQAASVPSQKTQASIKAKPVQEAKVLEPVLCQISCASKDAYKMHTYGKRHRTNLELQSGKSETMSRGPVAVSKEVLEKQKNKKKASEPNGDFHCRLCNVTCQKQVFFDSHLRGQKHAAALLSQSEASFIFKLFWLFDNLRIYKHA